MSARRVVENGEGRAVAVVVPTLDEEGTIRECLASIGDERGVEVVVTDGGSADRTLGIVRETFPWVRVVEGPRGRGGQLNRGAAASVAPLLLFLHADCILPAGWREAVLEALAPAGVSLGCFRLRTLPPPGRRAGPLVARWWRLLDLRGRGWGLPYGDQGLFLRRATFDAVGGFPAIPLMEDLALVRRCLAAGELARAPLEVQTTARRFARHPVRARVCTATFPLLFRLGVSPERLARWYGSAR